MKVSIGTIALFAGDFTPNYWLPCDGSTYLGDRKTVLRAVRDTGCKFDYRTNDLILPKLDNIGSVHHFINSRGAFPPGFLEENIIGFVTTLERLGVKEVPQGWALCDGTLSGIDEKNQFIASVIGTKYGGKKSSDGTIENFALPNLNKPEGKTYIICVEGVYPSPSRNWLYNLDKSHLYSRMNNGQNKEQTTKNISVHLR